MISTFIGLETAKRGLSTSQGALYTQEITWPMPNIRIFKAAGQPGPDVGLSYSGKDSFLKSNRLLLVKSSSWGVQSCCPTNRSITC